MSEKTPVIKKAPFGLFSELKQCEHIFRNVLKEQKDFDFGVFQEHMDALERKFLKEYPWAVEENYFILPNNAFKQILLSIDNPHKYKVFEMYKGNWKESPNTKDINYASEIPKDKPFVLHKIMICNDFIGGLKEREFAGRDICVPMVFTEFSVIQKIVYENSSGEMQESFEKDLRGMEPSQFFDFIPSGVYPNSVH